MRKLLIALALTSSALMSGGVAAASADTTVTVTPADITAGTHWFTGDTRPSGTGLFTAGPATPALGAGSFELGTPDTTAKVQLLTNLYSGTALSAVQGIGYSTYQNYAATAQPAMVALNLRVDFNNDTLPDNYMVYEPYQDQGNAAITKGAWQNWDAYRGGAAKWWISGANVIGSANPCSQSVPCTFTQIKALYPVATIRDGANCGVKVPCPGSLGLNQGSSNAGVVSNADALYVTVGGNKTTYDFEAAADTAGPECGEFVVRRNPGGHDEADVTLHDNGSGIKSITNFTVTNGTASIPVFNQGDHSVTVTAIKDDQNARTFFEFDVTDMAGNTTHCV